MNRIIAILLLSLASSAYALPNCPSDKSAGWHNCFGTYTSANGNKYVGEFKDDKYHGQGTYTWANGTKYVGEFKDGNRNGQGTVTHSDGDKYVGGWKDDKYHGQGTYTLDNGDKYVGEWKDNLPNGKGTNTFTNGNKYVGEFKDDKYHGQGTLTYASGKIEKGIWKMDTYKGAFVGTMAEWDAKERAREEAKNKHQRIYNACLLDKSSGVDMQVRSLRKAVEETCAAIAEDPSWYDELKYD